ncbi:lumican [Chanos chanos]|uniref:Lumican n=1 Tax=Chanos chanos TaxID=29144 RepID=A0A6J2V2N7_CHACN|nr:lumican [Chanos chanos]
MAPLHLFLLAGVFSVGLCQYYDYGDYYAPVSLSTPNCAQECECPINFPSAMYCDNRNLKFIPIVPSGIKYLYLQNNQINEIKAGVFDNVTDLRWLVLDYNQITSEKIQSGTIDKLGSLEKLHFNYNNLTKPPGPLSKSMMDLKMTGNQLSTFPAGTLAGMENLTTLYINNNKLTSESIAGAFKGLKSLMLLDVSHNKLKKLPSGVPSSLMMLYADYNDIDSVPSGYLAKLPALQYLRISHNKLVDSGIPAGVFNVSLLTELDLSFNKLTSIPEINESLEYLYLQVNDISKFELGSFCKFSSPVNYSRLRILRLDGNNLTQGNLPADTSNCLRQVSELIIN